MQFLPLIIHELISRGVALTQSAYFEKIILENSKNEFHQLSLSPSTLESENNFPSYYSNGGGHNVSFGFQRNEAYENLEITELTTIR
jgi:hypothetical protein